MVTNKKEIKTITEFILTNHKVHASGQKLVIDGSPRTRKRGLSEFYPPKKDYMSLGIGNIAFLEEKELVNLDEDIFNDVVQTLPALLASTLSQSMPSTSVHYQELIPCIDIKSSDYVLYDEGTGWVSDINFKTWDKRLPKKLKDACLERTRDCILEYSPRALEPLRESRHDGHDVIVLNTCRHPEWRYSPSEVTPKLEDNFLQYFDQLFDNKESRQYCIDWINEAVYGRNSTYLVLNGKKGIGKGLLTTALSSVVGHANYAEAQRSFLTKEFNIVLLDKRIVLLDEISIENSDHRNKLKSYLNRLQMVEGKGKDAVQVELHCSMVISNNDASDMNIEQDDRRFSVMDLDETPLLAKWSNSHVQTLWEYIESDDFSEAFSTWIAANASKDFNHNIPYKGETFDNLVMSSLKVWQTKIVNVVTSKARPKYALSELRNNTDMFPAKNQKIRDFLKNFTWDGECLGTVSKIDGMMYIKPNTKFMPDTEEEL